METQPKRVVGRPFEPGNPGRPKGSRNKLAEDFVKALHDDFQEHGPEAIKQTREKDPAAYVKVCASLLPKELKIERADDLSDDELDARIRQLASVIGLEIGTGGTSGGEAPKDQPEPAGGVSTLQ